MDWTQVMTIVGANMALFLWAVRQSRSDYLHCQRLIDAFKDGMMKETKDFHGKLCSLEERMRFKEPRKDP
jgi:hypothetical protein